MPIERFCDRPLIKYNGKNIQIETKTTRNKNHSNLRAITKAPT